MKNDCKSDKQTHKKRGQTTTVECDEDVIREGIASGYVVLFTFNCDNCI